MKKTKRADNQRKSREEYAVHTGQETDAIMRAASDGKRGGHWREVEQIEAWVFEMPGLSHYVRLQLTANDVTEGLGAPWLHDLREQQDSDSAFALLYIARQMVELQATPNTAAKNAVIDIDDVISGIGFDPRNTKQRVEMRERIWTLILFGERAQIVGKRNGTYQEKATGKTIETTMESAPWRVMAVERPEQLALYGEVPVRVELAASNEWMRLLTSPDTAQFLPMGEVLGAIAPAKASGAWARVIGLALANLWRRKPREALNGELRPTRQALIKHYTPRIAAVEDILSSKNPTRAIEYWAAALEILTDCGFLEKQGEAALTYEEMRSALGRQDWADKWLESNVVLLPGQHQRSALEKIAKSLPVFQPRNLTKTGKNRKTR